MYDIIGPQPKPHQQQQDSPVPETNRSPRHGGEKQLDFLRPQMVGRLDVRATSNRRKRGLKSWPRATSCSQESKECPNGRAIDVYGAFSPSAHAVHREVPDRTRCVVFRVTTKLPDKVIKYVDVGAQCRRGDAPLFKHPSAELGQQWVPFALV